MSIAEQVSMLEIARNEWRNQAIMSVIKSATADIDRAVGAALAAEISKVCGNDDWGIGYLSAVTVHCQDGYERYVIGGHELLTVGPLCCTEKDGKTVLSRNIFSTQRQEDNEIDISPVVRIDDSEGSSDLG